MRQLGWFSSAALFTGVMIGCAQRPAAQCKANPAAVASASVRASTVELGRDTSLRALEWKLARHAREQGLGHTVAFVWGDVTPLPGSIPVHIAVKEKSLDGWLVGGAHELDVGKLAPEIENVSIVEVEDKGLFASHPSLRGRQVIDLDGPKDSESKLAARVVFAMVDGESGHEVPAENAVEWLSKLSGWVRYGVLALPDV
jgi:hypothetical protein